MNITYKWRKVLLCSFASVRVNIDCNDWATRWTIAMKAKCSDWRCETTLVPRYFTSLKVFRCIFIKFHDCTDFNAKVNLRMFSKRNISIFISQIKHSIDASFCCCWELTKSKNTELIVNWFFFTFRALQLEWMFCRFKNNVADTVRYLTSSFMLKFGAHKNGLTCDSWHATKWYLLMQKFLFVTISLYLSWLTKNNTRFQPQLPYIWSTVVCFPHLFDHWCIIEILNYLNYEL